MGDREFSDEQKRYLEGFVSGVHASRVAAGLKPLAGVAGNAAARTGPDAAHLAADALDQDGGIVQLKVTLPPA